MPYPEELQFFPGDTDNNVLRKILGTLQQGTTSDGTVVIKDATSNNKAAVSATGAVLVEIEGGGGGGGTAATIADGADVALGATTDPAQPLGSVDGSVISFLKGALGWLGSMDTSLGSISLQLGTLATESTLLATNGYLVGISAKLPAVLGQTTMANSLSVTLASDQSDVHTNLKRMNGTSVSVGSGTVDAGTQRVTLPTDVNVPTNLKQINGTTIDTNSGNASAGTQRVVLATNSPAPLAGLLGYGARDIFGSVRVAEQRNTIDIQFYRDTPQALTTVTTSNGGTASSSLGGALFETNTNTNGGIKSVSPTYVTYHGGAEIYAYFTLAFSVAGLANSYSRVGLYDASNGVFLGFEGTTFNASYRNNAANTQTPQGSFNVDTLTGSASSQFTRGGTPEAIDFTKFNVFRIRFGWVGGAQINYEVLSPDGNWVLFHQVRAPNLLTAPSIRNADLPFTLDLQKTGAGATNYTAITGCWAAGNTASLQDRNIVGAPSQTSLNNNVILDTAGSGPADALGYGAVSIQIVPAAGTVTAGTITFESSNDNVNWTTVPLYDAASPTATPVTSYNVAASTVRFFAGQVARRFFRARISTGITGTTTGVQCFSSWHIAAFSPPFQQSVISPAQSTVTDRSGTISSGGVAQTLANANTSRKYLIIQNLSAENLYINFTTTAVQGQPSLLLLPNGSFVMEGSFVSTEAVSIIGATTGSAFAAKEG